MLRDCPFDLCRPRPTDHTCARDLCEHTNNRFTLGYARIRLQCTINVLLCIYIYLVIRCSAVYSYHRRRESGLIYKSENISGNPLGTHVTGSPESYICAHSIYYILHSWDLPH